MLTTINCAHERRVCLNKNGMNTVIDLLKQPAQLPEGAQRHIAEMILAEIDPDKRWEELLNNPGSEAVLEELPTQAGQQKPLSFPQPRGEE